MVKLKDQSGTVEPVTATPDQLAPGIALTDLLNRVQNVEALLVAMTEDKPNDPDDPDKSDESVGDNEPACNEHTPLSHFTQGAKASDVGGEIKYGPKGQASGYAITTDRTARRIALMKDAWAKHDKHPWRDG